MPVCRNRPPRATQGSLTGAQTLLPVYHAHCPNVKGSLHRPADSLIGVPSPPRTHAMFELYVEDGVPKHGLQSVDIAAVLFNADDNGVPKAMWVSSGNTGGLVWVLTASGDRTVRDAVQC